MDRSEQAIFTNMCMVYDNYGNVLVQDRKDTSWGGITFPGGHVEKGEAFTDSVIREVYEETGLHISSPQLCGMKQWPHLDGSRYVVLFFKANKFSGELVSSKEGEVYWVRLDDFKSMKLAEGMDKMLEVFLNDDINEYFLYKDNDKWADELK